MCPAPPHPCRTTRALRGCAAASPHRPSSAAPAIRTVASRGVVCAQPRRRGGRVRPKRKQNLKTAQKSFTPSNPRFWPLCGGTCPPQAAFRIRRGVCPRPSLSALKAATTLRRIASHRSCSVPFRSERCRKAVVRGRRSLRSLRPVCPPHRPVPVSACSLPALPLPIPTTFAAHYCVLFYPPPSS